MTDLNRYSPYYDHDENQTRMSIDENGSWVHITKVNELLAALRGAENVIAAMNENEERMRVEFSQALKETAERQREVCAKAVESSAGITTLKQWSERVRATPLVTDEKP